MRSFTKNELARKLLTVAEEQHLVRNEVRKYQTHPKYSLIFSPEEVQSEILQTIANVVAKVAEYRRLGLHKKRNKKETDLRLDTDKDIIGYFINSFRNAMVDMFASFQSQKRSTKEILFDDMPGYNNEDQESPKNYDNYVQYDPRELVEINDMRRNILTRLRQIDRERRKSKHHIRKLGLVYVRMISKRYNANFEAIRKKCKMTNYILNRHKQEIVKILENEFPDVAKDIIKYWQSNYTEIDLRREEQEALRSARYGNTKKRAFSYENDHTCTTHVTYLCRTKKSGDKIVSAVVSVDRLVKGYWESVHKKVVDLPEKYEGLPFDKAKERLAKIIKEEVEKANEIAEKRKRKYLENRHLFVSSSEPKTG